ncbi:DUF3850 domain-containing protein [Enterobacteriaceae bacterium C34A]
MADSTLREKVTHDLKIYPEFFAAVCAGLKRAELRKNDRDYQVGDNLHLMETPRGSCLSTGEFFNVTITHIADVGEWMPGYVMLSIAQTRKQQLASAFRATAAESAGVMELMARGVEAFIPYLHADVTSDEAQDFANKLRSGRARNVE